MNLVFKLLCPFLIVGGIFLFHSNNAIGQTMDYLFDPTFAPQNIVGGNHGSPTSILVHDDGRYTIVGPFSSNWPLNIPKGVRLFNDGSIDETFSISSIDPLFPGYLQFYQDGYIFWDPNTLGVVDSNGNWSGSYFLDLSHSPYQLSTPPFPYTAMYQIMVDDKLMVAGRFSPDTTNLEDRRHLVRVHPDGSPDTSFEPLKCHEPYDARIIDLFPAPNGKWMIAGEFMDVEGFESPGIARLNEDFSVDTSFHSPFPSHTWEIRIVPGAHPQELLGAIDEQGRIYVGHLDSITDFNYRKNVRLLPNGAIDSTFSPPEMEKYYVSGNSAPGHFQLIAFEPDGTLIVGGNFRKMDGLIRNCIAKLNEDGSLIENVFNRLGADTANWQNGENPDINMPSVTAMVRLDNGGLMVGGRFSRYDGHDQWGLVRLLPSPVGVEEHNANEISVSCFPNPASDFVRFSVKDPSLPANAQIEVYDNQGKRVQSYAQYLLQQPFNISSLNAGLYNVIIRFEDKQVATTRFVKTSE